MSLTPGNPSNTAAATGAAKVSSTWWKASCRMASMVLDLDEPPLADDRHPVAGAVDLVDDVRRQEDVVGLARLADEAMERRAGSAGRGPTSARRAPAGPAGAGTRRRRPSADCPFRLLEPPARIELEPLDQVRRRRPCRPRPAGPRRTRTSVARLPGSYRSNSAGR